MMDDKQSNSHGKHALRSYRAFNVARKDKGRLWPSSDPTTVAQRDFLQVQGHSLTPHARAARSKSAAPPAMFN